MKPILLCLLCLLRTVTCLADDAASDLFARQNLVAWCIVPFDANKRGPEERAAMLDRLGIKRLAYDWRAEHVPTFAAEIEATKRHGIEFTAFWGAHEEAFKLFEKHGLKPQIWVVLPKVDAATQEERVKQAAEQILPIVRRAGNLGSALAIYNHGGWGGEPANMVAVTKLLREKHDAAHVGIVYNLHHGHDHIHDFASVLADMRPYLVCLNLNGMNDNAQPKILPVGSGQHDRQMIEVIKRSGYAGPIGILCHRADMDAEVALQQNLNGLKKLLREIGDEAALKTYP
ncbi:MAG: sugar phosphate isomerase/epimerase family protein [Planctomycetota bacterium]